MVLKVSVRLRWVDLAGMGILRWVGVMLFYLVIPSMTAYGGQVLCDLRRM